MGIERMAISSKLSPENVEFLEQQKRALRPYDVSISSLINVCVRIVREMHARGELSLKPEDLQKLLIVERGDVFSFSRGKNKSTWRAPGSPSFTPSKPKRDA